MRIERTAVVATFAPDDHVVVSSIQALRPDPRAELAAGDRRATALLGAGAIRSALVATRSGSLALGFVLVVQVESTPPAKCQSVTKFRTNFVANPR